MVTLKTPFFKNYDPKSTSESYKQKGIVLLPSAVLTALHIQAILNSISFDEQVPTAQNQQRKR